MSFKIEHNGRVYVDRSSIRALLEASLIDHGGDGPLGLAVSLIIDDLDSENPEHYKRTLSVQRNGKKLS